MKHLYKFLIKTFITIIITIILLIVIKVNPNYKQKIYYNLYEKSFSFAYINEEYQKHFGSPIPFIDLIKTEKPVFNEKIQYKEANKYKEGVKLSVTSEYVVPNYKKGIVVFIGEKDDYNKTVIIEQTDGVEVWYGNLDEINVSLYDYIEQGKIIGSCKNYLYIVYKKDGKILNYNDFI